MSLLREGSVNNDGLVFRQGFRLRREIQDQTGVLVGCTVGLGGPGIKPTAASSRVTYDNTRALLINANKMTIRVKLRTAPAFPDQLSILCKSPTALNDNQWMLEILATGVLILYVANAAADTGQYAYSTALSANTTYVGHVVYDGTLAAGSRVIWYLNGVATGTTIAGVIPTVMRAGGSPITVFNRDGANNRAPVGTTLFDASVWGRAFSPAEVLDDAMSRTF